MRAGEIRSTANPAAAYFKNIKPNPDFLAKMDAVQELLRTGGRSLTQSAICWLWAKGERNIPIPGVRTVEQLEGIAGAISFGAFASDEMAQIEAVIKREPDEPLEKAR